MAFVATTVLSVGQAGALPLVATAAQPSVDVIFQSQWFEPFFGGQAVHIIGQVRNDTTENVTLIRIGLNLLDAAGKSVGTDWTISGVNVLGPGEVSPFEDILLPAPANYSNFAVTGVMFARATATPYHSQLPVTLTTCPATAPSQEVCGSVTNIGAVQVEDVHAVLTFLNASGAMVAQNAVSIDPPGTLTPGQTGPFSVDRTGDPSYSSVLTIGEPDYPVDLNPSGLDFENQLVGTASPLQSTTLTNNGQRALAIQNIAASGDFRAVASDCPSSLAPAASCSVVLTFIPTVHASENGLLTITDDGAGNPESIPLSGTGVAPVVSLVPSGGSDFGTITVGQSSAPKPIALANVGDYPLTVTSVGASGDFSLVQPNACVGTLAVNATCVIYAVFTPGLPGQRSGSLTLIDNALDSPQQLALTGFGLSPAVTFNPPSLNFGDADVVITQLTVTVISSGTSDLTITGISTTGPFAATPCQAGQLTLPPGAACTVTVTFLPVGTRPVGGYLIIADNLGDQLLQLSGNAAAARGPSSGPANSRSGSPPPPPRTP